MKKLSFFAIIFFAAIEIQAQNVGIGTTTPATILDVTSTTQGVLIPRVTTAEMNAIVSPANGLLVTNTDSANTIFVYTGTGWRGLSFGGATVDTSLLVHKSGAETIADDKVFVNDITVNGTTIGRGKGSYFRNVAIGSTPLFSNVNGRDLLAIGTSTLFSNTTGAKSLAIGTASLFYNLTGIENVGVGHRALVFNTSGNSNTALGAFAGNVVSNGSNNTSVNNSTFLGANTKSLAINQTNEIVIGFDAVGLGSNSAVIGNSNILLTSLKGQVGINNSAPDPSAQLDVTSTTKGLLLPRLTKAQRDAIVAAAAGLVIYQTDNVPGLRVYNGTNWVRYTEIAD
jgi:trimeric autotransporter adhesin